MEEKIACLLICVLSLASSAACYPVLFSSCRSTGVNDDDSNTMSLSVPFRFYGRSYRSVSVSITASVHNFLGCIQMHVPIHSELQLVSSPSRIINCNENS